MPEAAIEFATELCVPATHPCLSGHFPEHPVLPAVLLLDLAGEALRARLGPLHLNRIDQMKFLRPIAPGEHFTLHFAAEPASGRARLRIAVGETLAAQGELRFVRD